jgi:hypothetical protein
MAGSTGVAPAYVDLESTRSHCDPPPAFQLSIYSNPIFMDTALSYHGSETSTTMDVSTKRGKSTRDMMMFTNYIGAPHDSLMKYVH